MLCLRAVVSFVLSVESRALFLCFTTLTFVDHFNLFRLTAAARLRCLKTFNRGPTRVKRTERLENMGGTKATFRSCSEQAGLLEMQMAPVKYFGGGELLEEACTS